MAESPADPALRVSGLAFAYPDGHQALFGIDLSVDAGERVAVLGPNGAGKTTFLLHLNGILGTAAGSDSVGEVRIGGTLVERRTVADIRRRVGFVFQDPDDQLFMPTVRDDVAFGPANFGLRGDELDARVDEALAAVDMSKFADRAPHHLSFGQRRRVAIATVLATDCDLLVLDEPTSNLDPQSRRELIAIVEALPVTTLVVTHDLPFAMRLCPRSVILDGGRIVADGVTGDLLTDPALLARHRLELPEGFDPERLRSAPRVQAG